MGCPQGSVIGPYLWNLGFDDLLATPLPSGCTLTGYADDGLLLIQSNTRAGLENLAKDCLSRISRWGEQSQNNFYALTRISKATWGLSFLTLRTIYGATYLGCVCYGAPVWADRATIGAVRRKLLQGQRLALIFLCKAYRTVSTEALPVLAGLLPVDLEVQRRAAMYYNARPNFSANFLAQRDRNKIARLLKPLTDVWDELLTEWQCRWESSTKGRHLYQFFPSVHERLERTWLEVDHCVAQFLTGHGNFKSNCSHLNSLIHHGANVRQRSCNMSNPPITYSGSVVSGNLSVTLCWIINCFIRCSLLHGPCGVSSEFPYDYVDVTATPFYVIAHYCQFILCISTFIYGLASWYILKKFRTFNNYVYLSAILVNILRLSVVSITLIHCDERYLKGTCMDKYSLYTLIFFTTVYNYWLLIMTYMFYVDIVKVFENNVERKFLKSILFAWGVPIIVAILCLLISLIIEFSVEGDKERLLLVFVAASAAVACNYLPSVINLILFIKLIYVLFCSKHSDASAISDRERRIDNFRRFLTASAIFILSNVVVLTFILWDLLDFSILARAITLSVQIIAIAVFVPLLKINRNVWYEYFQKRKLRNIS
ncbi:hypothetical protein SFRURICE_011382 [Spodoptera frugiperda]|nr:hypothetical protein SFRURICE_011382 [Spodoptera frugiperda]